MKNAMELYTRQLEDEHEAAKKAIQERYDENIKDGILLFGSGIVLGFIIGVCACM